MCGWAECVAGDEAGETEVVPEKLGVFGKVFAAGLEGFRQPAPHGGARPGLGVPGSPLASPPDAPFPVPCPPER